jgi:putative ABC transport system permease protein
MEIRPILSTLKRNPVAAILIGLQIALTLAILANVLFIVSDRIDRMNRPSGMDEANIFSFGHQNIGTRDDARLAEEDEALLSKLPGVQHVSPIFSLPLGQSGWQTGVNIAIGEQVRDASRLAAIYFGDENFLQTLGVDLIEGRYFTPSEIQTFRFGDQPDPPVILVSKSLADKLFPGQSAVGKMVNITGQEGVLNQQIIGVVGTLASPWPNSRNPDRVIIAPFRPVGIGGYMVRTQAGERDRVMAQVEQALMQSYPDRVIDNLQSFEETRADTHRNNRAIAMVLSAVALALMAVTAFGIVGQASFWVVQRTRQIGTRRALGARKVDILRYFQTENFLITTIAVLLGCALALGLNGLLVTYFSFERLPLGYLPAGVVIVYLLGQMAVLGPALRASRIAPAIATRSA